MSQDLRLTTESPSQPDCVLLNPRIAFMKAMKKVNIEEERIYDFLEIKELLSMAGFSQNGRNRILHLSSDEMSELCKSSPADEELWCSYVSELQTLLSKMDQARNVDSSFGRPYVTTQLASTACKLARLRYLHENSFSSVQASKMQDLLKHDSWCKSVARLVGIGQSTKQMNSESILIQSAIRLLELYRDELIMPPRLKCRVNFDDFDLQMIESGDLHWMDDGGKSYLENIRDVPLITHYDELPNIESVLDWFVATKPVFDNNQIKLGWAFLERSSEDWHACDESYGFSEELISEYPGWNCLVANHQDEWLSTFPPNNPYMLIPLTMPHQLLEESKKMHHCVVTYLEGCISGNIRIFSVRDASNDQRIATAELAIHSGLWKVVQLKGKHNQELIHRTHVLGDPLAIILDALEKFHNEVLSLIRFANE